MYPTAGGDDRITTARLPKREAPVGMLRKWRSGSVARGAAGENRTLSFLVCRMRGFERLVESYAADPDGLCRIVRRGTTVLADVVRAHGGTVDRAFAGGFSAFFNAPREASDHVIKACECALAMLAAMAEVNRKIANGADPLRIGIGLNSGSAVFGDFGTEDRPHFAAIGLPVQRADALEQLSASYGTAILTGPGIEKDAERRFAFLHVDHQSDGEGAPLPISALLAPPLSRSHPKFLALKSFHAHIFDAFRARNWTQARNLVGQCRALSEANPVLYDFYRDRIAHYEANPPAPDWNGNFLPAMGLSDAPANCR